MFIGCVPPAVPPAAASNNEIAWHYDVTLPGMYKGSDDPSGVGMWYIGVKSNHAMYRT